MRYVLAIFLSISTLYGTSLALDGSLPYIVTPIESNPGIYYEELQDLRTFNNRWKLVSFVNIGNFIYKSTVLEKFVNLLLDECHVLGPSCQYEDTIKLSQDKLKTLINRQTEIKDLLEYQGPNVTDLAATHPSGRRIRRGVFDFVGEFQKELFGSLSASDDRYFKEHIDRLFNDTNQLAIHETKLTQYVKPEFEAHRNELDNIGTHLTELDDQLEAVKRNLLGVNGKVDANSIAINLMKHISKLDKILNEHDSDLKILINAILFAKKGIIHPGILSPKQLIESLQKVQASYQLLRFPTPLTSKYAEELIRISELGAVFSEPNLIYVLSIPLLNVDSFNLYHLLPIPVQQNYDNTHNKFAYITSSEDYIAISLDRNSYLQFSNSDITDCKSTQAMFLCEQNQPLYRTSSHQNCELELFLNNEQPDLHKCNVRIASFDAPYWSKLRSPNSWIYALSKPDTLHISCGDSRQARVTLSGTGVLHLANHCKGDSGVVSLSTSNVFASYENRRYVPKFSLNLTAIYNDLKQNHATNLSEIPILNRYNPIKVDRDELIANGIALDDIISQAKEISTHRRDKQEAATWKRKFSFFGIGIGSLAVLYLLYRFSVFSLVFKLLKLISCPKKSTQNRPSREHAAYANPVELEIVHTYRGGESMHESLEIPNNKPPPLPRKTRKRP